jgi:hypothetical protein
MADADRAAQRIGAELVFEIAEFAFGAATPNRAILERGDAGTVIAAIFEPLQRLDHTVRDRRNSDDPDNAAHGPIPISFGS